MDKIDEQMMQVALKVAQRGRFKTWHNPLVGAVVVKHGKILSVGAHEQYGKEHAEVNALAQLSVSQSSGATLYVTLEPCCHTGKQPPCVAAIIAAKIKRVVIACRDAHAVVNGKGIAMLKKAGIIVDDGCLFGEAYALNRHYFHYYQQRRPWITLKFATTLDGRISLAKNQRTQLSDASASRFMHDERANFDAILVGKNTVLVDNPHLTTPQQCYRPPLRVILDRQAITAKQHDLFVWDDAAPTLLITQKRQVIAPAKNVAVCVLDQITPQAVMAELYRRQIHSVYIEGGAQIHQAFLEAKMWDEVICYTAPIIGGDSGTLACGNGVNASFERLHHVKITQFDDTVRIAGKRRN